jgi:methionyl-tRNA synthetase
MVLGQDSSFNPESFIKRYNSDLANDFGNLLNRVSGLIGKYFGGKIPEEQDLTSEEEKIKDMAVCLQPAIHGLINELRMDEAIEEIMTLVRYVNRYLEQQAPWKVAKTDLRAAGRILYTATEALRLCAVFLAPVMPAKSEQVLDILGAAESTEQWGQLKSGFLLKSHEALFPRIESE